MLRRLSVENYALIDKLEMELDPHLNIITGETGAGWWRTAARAGRKSVTVTTATGG